MVSFYILISIAIICNHYVRADVPDISKADYVVVGAGAAGCIVAARLVEAGHTVIVLEAGKDPPKESETTHMYFKFYTMEEDQNWKFKTVKQENALKEKSDQTTTIDVGKMEGGSGNINALFYFRGTRYDYDKWKENGATGWGYDDFKQYLLKLEDAHLENMENHETGGRISITDESSREVPIIESFIKAAEEKGSTRGDLNDGEGDKVGRVQFNYYDGKRQSSWYKYLKQHIGSDKLSIVPSAVARKINFDNQNRATSVEYTQVDSREGKITVSKEVILCAGAIGTPKLLMLSGIGPKEHLQEHNIPLISDRPVGQNFVDHLSILFKIFTTTEEKEISAAAALVKSEEGRTPNDIQIFQGTYKNDVYAVTFLLTPDSIGEVKLKSSDWREKPIVDPKLLNVDKDKTRLAKGLKMHMDIVDSMDLSSTGYEKVPLNWPENCLTEGEPNYECIVEYRGNRGNHPVGTARMGAQSDQQSVVDPELKVIGVHGLRVADASVMPTMIAANTQVATMAIAEKAADLILNAQN